MVWPLWETICQFLRKLNSYLPYYSKILLLGIYPREMKTYVHREVSAWMFTAILFTTAKKWKWNQPKRPSVGEWINTLWDRSVVECYLAIESCELLVLLSRAF